MSSVTSSAYPDSLVPTGLSSRVLSIIYSTIIILSWQFLQCNVDTIQFSCSVVDVNCKLPSADWFTVGTLLQRKIRKCPFSRYIITEILVDFIATFFSGNFARFLPLALSTVTNKNFVYNYEKSTI